MTDDLKVAEIFLSLQGESTHAGLPCIFVRLAGCNLRCAYCDTAYAFEGGAIMSPPEVRARLEDLARPYRQQAAPALPLVELTGGEPLLQPGALPLLQALCDDGYTVLLETHGALDIGRVDPRVRRIMDLKCPSSGESHRIAWGNLRHLQATDEVKFVIATREDYDWAKQVLAEHRLSARCPVLISWAEPMAPDQRHPSLKPAPPASALITRRELAERILADALPVRFQVQQHKVIWPPDQRGV